MGGMGNVNGFGNLFCHFQIKKLLCVVGFIVSVVLLYYVHMFVSPYDSISSPVYMGNLSLNDTSSVSIIAPSDTSHPNNDSAVVHKIVSSNVSRFHEQESVNVTEGEGLTTGTWEEESSNLGKAVAPISANMSIGSPTHHIVLKKGGVKPTSISQMNSLLLQFYASPSSMRPKWTSKCDREVQNARREIEKAPIIRNVPDAHASVFRNYSRFLRSYQLMERKLKVYVYREGGKPIFHQPYMRGIYASEGWFMKLMKANRQFVVKDAKRAYLFYLPFSSRNLRYALGEQNFTSRDDLENHLKKYVDVIMKKYRFWNRTMGADHFLVACHDWAPYFTRNHMSNCLRVLCNSNVARGFKIGKDVSLPVTSIRSANSPLEHVGGNLPSKRPILAFFAGGMHGYLRPTLLKYWSNKESDMKIFGPLPRDVEGKARYRDFMKSSRYCICAKGYQVHTPRVVESIYYGCVPVIISDNYVPPFFEVLDWEAFAVFVLEKDIPNLRSILLSISEEKFISMHQRLSAVQQHFLWHRNPLKYDIFHMILHSIWYNRVLQVKSG